MRNTNQNRLVLESFDDRIMPATFATSHVGSTLVITQTTPAVGSIIILDNPGAGIVVVDDALDANPPTVVSTAGFANLKVNLKPTDTSLVTYDIVSARSGSVALSVKNSAARTLDFIGGFTIGGNLSVVGGNGGLTVNELGSPMQVAGNASFVGGSNFDALNLGTIGGTSIGGKLTATRFNTLVTNAGDVIGGSLIFNDAGEGNLDVLALTDTEVGGNFNFVGGTAADTIVFTGTTPRVDGNLSVNFGGQAALDSSVLSQASGSTSVISGNVSVVGDNLGSDVVVLGGVVDGSIALNLGGGTNTAVLIGEIHGTSVKYTGGAGTDILTYALLAGSSSASLRAIFGAGSDTMSFGGAVSPSFAYLDFGAGTDTLIGAIAFPATILNLP